MTTSAPSSSWSRERARRPVSTFSRSIRDYKSNIRSRSSAQASTSSGRRSKSLTATPCHGLKPTWYLAATRSSAASTPRTPRQTFYPKPDRLLLYQEPTGPGIRVDAGVAEGDTVTVHYDPLLAKLAVWGETREWARRRAIDALTRYVVLGLRTNLSFLRRVLEDPRFRDGHTHTGFLAAQNDEGRAALTADPPPSLDQPALVAALAAAGAARHAAASTDRPSPRHLRDPWSTLRSWR